MINIRGDSGKFREEPNKTSQSIKDFESKMSERKNRIGELHAGTYPQGSRVEIVSLKSGMMLVVVREPESKEKRIPEKTA